MTAPPLAVVQESVDLGEVDGFHVFAYLVDEKTTLPQQVGSYSDEALEGFRVGDWHFVTLHVVAKRSGLEFAHVTVGACDHGKMQAVTYNAFDLIGSKRLVLATVQIANKNILAMND